MKRTPESNSTTTHHARVAFGTSACGNKQQNRIIAMDGTHTTPARTFALDTITPTRGCGWSHRLRSRCASLLASSVATVALIGILVSPTLAWAQNQPGENADDVLIFGDPEDDNGNEAGNFFGGNQGDGFNFEQPANGGNDAPADDEELVALAFKDTYVKDLVTTIAEWTGKPVWPHPNSYEYKVTLVNTELIPRSQALDLLRAAMFESSVAVVDRGEYIALMLVMDIQRGDVPVMGPREDVLERDDIGTVVEKVFQIRNGSAQNIHDILNTTLKAGDFVKLGVDAESNQIIVLSSIGTLYRVQRIINNLDIEAQGELVLETFHLQYSDAEKIAESIVGLFGEDEEGGGSGGGNIFGGNNRGGGRGDLFRQRGNNNQGQEATVTTTDRLRVAFNTQQNSVTVMAPREVLDQIRDQIEKEWDVPFSVGAGAKFYDLRHTDAVKLRDILIELFEGDQSGGSSVITDFNFFGGGGGRQSNRGASSGDAPPSLHPLAGQFSFAADPDKNRLIVVARTPEYYAIMDELISQFDSPSDVNLPILRQLEYASADELATQLNLLFAEAGVNAELRLSDTGLTDTGELDSGDGGSTNTTNTAQEGESFQPWWTQSRSAQGDDEERPISNMIAKFRIVPIARQNALLILTPPEYRDSILQTIEHLDQPGRQVLIAATVVEVNLEDTTALGIRWGSTEGIFNNANSDNEFRITNSGTGAYDPLFDDLFDTSSLTTNFNLNLALQALLQTTDSKILSNPRIVTSDNEEAIFFDGQDVPFIESGSTTDQGGINQNFEYRAVGIRLGVRPHITAQGNVDLLINLELSSIVPGQTLFGGFILDRRETTTKLTVRDRQTVVLSGILREEESEILRKVPLLGDLPLIGGIFRSKDAAKVNSELVAFITPIIMDNPEEAGIEFGPDRDVIRQQGFDPNSISENRGIPTRLPETDGEK